MLAKTRNLVVSSVFAVLFCSTALAQLNYSISTGPQVFAPLPAPPPAQILDLSVNGWSPFIAPSGFSFTFGGQAYTNFRVARSGHIGLGGSGAAPQQVVAPFNSYVAYGPSTRISWDLQGSTLVVEWLRTLDVTTAVGSPGPAEYSIQAMIDTATGVIEFRYAAASGGAFVPKVQDRHVVALRGVVGVTGNGRPVLPGNLPGFVNSDGTVSAWPSDLFMRFTPTGTTRQAPTVLVTRSGASLLPVAFDSALGGYRTVMEHGLRIAVSDADGDQSRVDARVRKIPATTPTPDIPESNFSSALSTTPYALSPATGVVNEGTYEIWLYVTDDVDGVHEFVFYLNWTVWDPNPPRYPCGEGKDSVCCSTVSNPEVLQPLMVALAFVAIALRLAGARRIAGH